LALPFFPTRRSSDLYVSFACSFAFAERRLMEGNAKIIRLIARDEALHLTGTQHILNIMQEGEDDSQMAEVAQACRAQSVELFRQDRKSTRLNSSHVKISYAV